MNRTSTLIISVLLVAVAALVMKDFTKAPAPAATAEPAAPKAVQRASVAPVAQAPVQVSSSCRGYTWVLRSQAGELASVGNDANSNGYKGDTDCAQALPLLCVHPHGLPAGNFRATQYDGWLGGEVALGHAVPGSQLTSRGAADALCAAEFGDGWRMGEHHDGRGSVGWGFTGVGHVAAGVRFWSSVNDQPSNPWDQLAQR